MTVAKGMRRGPRASTPGLCPRSPARGVWIILVGMPSPHRLWGGMRPGGVQGQGIASDPEGFSPFKGIVSCSAEMSLSGLSVDSGHAMGSFGAVDKRVLGDPWSWLGGGPSH